MSDRPSEPPIDEDDALAAELALGVLSGAERQAAEHRRDRDAAFAARVAAWEGRLEPLAAAFPDVAPPPGLKAAVEVRLFPQAARQPGLWASLGLWRGLTAALAAAVVALAFLVLRPQPSDLPTGQSALVASLTRQLNSDVAYAAFYDPAEGQITLTRISGEPGAARDFQLWLIADNTPPQSLGVLPDGPRATVVLPDALRAQMQAGVSLAVSREKDGGSTTGMPDRVVSIGPVLEI
jgi:anti-sigma-K factor RskA